MSTWLIVLQIDEKYEQYGTVVLVSGMIVFCFLCLGFLIVPKILPVFYQHVTTGQYEKAPPRERRSSKPNLRQSPLNKLISSITSSSYL